MAYYISFKRDLLVNIFSAQCLSLGRTKTKRFVFGKFPVLLIADILLMPPIVFSST